MRDYDTNYIPDLTERYPEGFGGIDTLSSRDLEYNAWSDYMRSFEEEEKRIKDNPFRFAVGQHHTIILNDGGLLKLTVSDVSEDRTKVLFDRVLINRDANNNRKETSLPTEWRNIEKDGNGEEISAMGVYPERHASYDTFRK